jgi:flagellar hook-associated protein 3 FlgL
MRVTERSRIGAMTLAQNRAAARLEKASRIASDGTRVSKPSDDPAAYGTKVRRDYTLAMLEEHNKIATRSLGELEVAHSALDAAVDIMARAEESAVSGANGTIDPAARKLLAEDVRTMREQLLAIANTRYGDKYIFAGTKSDTIPFDFTTGAFNGNDQIVRVPVMENVTPAANVSGAKAFTVTGGRDLFADLKELADALDASDDNRVRATMKNLQSGHDQLVRSQVEAGFGAERFRSALDVLTSTTTAVAEQLSKEIEGDPATQITELTLARTAYERSVAITKSLLSINSGG